MDDTTGAHLEFPHQNIVAAVEELLRILSSVEHHSREVKLSSVLNCSGFWPSGKRGLAPPVFLPLCLLKPLC